MKTTAEMKIMVSNARISRATILRDGTCKLELEMNIHEMDGHDDKCVLVEASKLSLNDDFMKHRPQTAQERLFKINLTKVIKNGIGDFYRPTMDPSFANESCKKIHYSAGELPAVGKYYQWWQEAVDGTIWKLGTKSQYIAFLGVLIKTLVSKGWKSGKAWNIVCNNSEELGHYCNSYNPKYQLEHTGSREICGFFDLGNTCKILANDDGTDKFLLAGGCYENYGDIYPLSNLRRCEEHAFVYRQSVAWLVRNN